MTAVRLLLGVAGLGMGAVGVEYLLTETRAGTVRDVLVWAGGTLILHDGLLAPAVFAVGLLLAGRRLRGVWRAGLLTAATVTLVTLPVLLRPGKPADPSVLPLDYPQGLTVVMAAVAAGTAATAGRHVWRRRQSR
ncbi:hypothetical protein OG946_24820 [Streptomyces sp. NBC_01808]|uniref:hypothetical protein n=1 Tax=Streptomyces sp. NBC_01808 TaxID=2975947 RepID=UPI002DDC1723|nr:hypothetical protein [Streptomyces sp. NBC_01808]WSA40306.1 hypothetical protein OG946_24820 [Streptomyces sp. NBC_01808]